MPSFQQSSVTVERTKKFTYDMGSELDSFLRKRCFLFCFVHVVLLISLEIMRKNYISRFILQGSNIIFKNVLDVRCSLRKIKWHFMGIFGSERCGNAALQRRDLYDYVS